MHTFAVQTKYKTDVGHAANKIVLTKGSQYSCSMPLETTHSIQMPTPTCLCIMSKLVIMVQDLQLTKSAQNSVAAPCKTQDCTCHHALIYLLPKREILKGGTQGFMYWPFAKDMCT